MRGLAARLETPIFSPDDRLIADRSSEWQVGVWDRKTGALKVVLDAPPGGFPDNVGLAISPDNRRIAFSSDRQARMWDLETGRVLGSWTLPAGLQDKLVFQGPNRLMLARAETINPDVAPYSTDPEKYPRLCAIYDLLGKEPTRPLRTIRDVNLHIGNIRVSPDGSTLLTCGWGGANPVVLSLNAYDLTSGQSLWRLPYQSRPNVHATPNVEFDPTGMLLQVEIAKETFALLDPRTGAIREASSSFVMGPRAELRMDVLWSPSSPSGSIVLLERGKPEPLLTLDVRTTAAYVGRFSRDGLAHASDSRSGTTVTLMDLPEIRRRLSEVGLGW